MLSDWKPGSCSYTFQLTVTEFNFFFFHHKSFSVSWIFDRNQPLLGLHVSHPKFLSSFESLYSRRLTSFVVCQRVKTTILEMIWPGENCASCKYYFSDLSSIDKHPSKLIMRCLDLEMLCNQLEAHTTWNPRLRLLMIHSVKHFGTHPRRPIILSFLNGSLLQEHIYRFHLCFILFRSFYVSQII